MNSRTLHLYFVAWLRTGTRAKLSSWLLLEQSVGHRPLVFYTKEDAEETRRLRFFAGYHETRILGVTLELPLMATAMPMVEGKKHE